MGGASSWYAMLAITGFMVCVWTASRVSRIIGVSSIVPEVAVGLVLGPAAGNLIPGELSECYDKRYIDCGKRKFQEKIAHKGYYYCDLGQYLKEDKYNPGGAWDKGFWGATSQVTLYNEDYESFSGTYCLNPKDNACKKRMLMEQVTEVEGSIETRSSLSARPAEAISSLDDEEASARLNKSGRMLLSEARWGAVAGTKGETKYDSYSECIMESCNLDRALKCATTPDIFTLVGHTGVAMMIFESGMHFDFQQARTVGPWACAVAMLGTFLPIISGCAVSLAFGFDFMQGLAAGVSLAPTSVGIALKLLHEAQALQLYFGQAVMTAAFVDDVLSLILFSVLFSLGDSMDFWTFVPLISGCIFMVVAIVAAVTVWPPLVAYILKAIPEDKPEAKVTRHDEILFALMLVTLLAYAEITHECGTHLWGCFIAGMNFSTMHRAHHVWVRQVKRYTRWWLRIFFACTLAWSIPVDELFSITALWKGTLMGIGPCIASKVLCAPFMGSARWAIGWAMVGRAEFAYFIAIMAKSLGMMPDDLFAILLWALIYATIFAPLLFRRVLARYMKSQGQAVEHHVSERSEGSEGTEATRSSDTRRRIKRAASNYFPDKVDRDEHFKAMQDAEKAENYQELEEQNEELRAELEAAKATIAMLRGEGEVIEETMKEDSNEATTLDSNATSPNVSEEDEVTDVSI